MTIPEILKKLESLGSPDNVAGMSRFGITSEKLFGVPAPELKAIAKDLKEQAGDRHELASGLWATGVHEARILAYLVDDPKRVTEKQMESWVRDFDNWAICDGTCGHLFCRTPFAYQKVFDWSSSEVEFIKRAGIVLMAWLAVHDKRSGDDKIAQFLPVLESKADDDRNLIKKAVSWSLRQIGKRNRNLNGLAIDSAKRIKERDTTSARWIAADAGRELQGEKVQERLKKKAR